MPEASALAFVSPMPVKIREGLMKSKLSGRTLSVFALAAALLWASLAGPAVSAAAPPPQHRGAAVAPARPAPQTPAPAQAAAPLAEAAPFVNKVLPNGLEVI